MSAKAEFLMQKFSRFSSCASQEWGNNKCKVALNGAPGNYAVIDIDCVTRKFPETTTGIKHDKERGDLLIVAEGGGFSIPLMIPVEIKKGWNPQIGHATRQLQGLVKFCSKHAGGFNCHFFPVLACRGLNTPKRKMLSNQRILFKQSKHRIRHVPCGGKDTLWKAIEQAIA